MEATVRKPRKSKVKENIAASEIIDMQSAIKKQPVLEKSPKRRGREPGLEKKIIFMTPPSIVETTPAKTIRKRKTKEKEIIPETLNDTTQIVEQQKTPAKSPRKRKAKIAVLGKDVTITATPAPSKKSAKSTRKPKIAQPAASVEAAPTETPKPTKKKKATQASWDKWVKATVVAVSPDVWNIYASELSHNSQFLTDLRKLPTRVLLDTPALDYLFRCPDRLSHNARLVLNEEGIECLVSLESIHEWADKIRAGHYLIDKENGFFDKIFDRFDLESVLTTTEVFQKYISLKANAFVDVSWERKLEDVVSTRLNADERPTRIIAALALVLGVPILSPDLRYDAYKKDGLKTVW